MAGGYREGSGRSKSGYYNGVYCGSTYELCWVIYNLDHNIKFSRFPGKLESSGVIYYPDFLLSDGKTIVETKGYEKKESVDKKTDVAESLGYTVMVLRKDDLKHMFDYVKEKYGTSKFHELYDGYKPTYSHLCDCCSIEFFTDRKIKTDTKFCSRVCSGKYRKIQNSTSVNYDKVSKSLLGKKMNPYKRKHKQIWITNGVVSTRQNESELIPEGFQRGRC